MSSFQQICPACQSTLELPSEAEGKAAVCPACQSRFVAAAPNVPSASTAPQPLAKSYRQVSIESILGDTQTLFVQRRRPLLLPFLIPSIGILLGLVLPLAHLSDMTFTNRTKGLAWTAMLTPWFLLVTAYSFWFALNLAIDVCDAGPEGENEPPKKLRSWFLPDRRGFIALLMTITAAIGISAGLIVVAMVLSHLGRKAEAIEFQLLLGLGAVIGGAAMWVLVAMRFWPLIPLAMRGRFGSSVLKESLAITRLNLMTSFLLVVAIFFLLGIGFSLFGLGLPIAIPLASLALVVALRLIEGRRIPAFEGEEP